MNVAVSFWTPMRRCRRERGICSEAKFSTRVSLFHHVLSSISTMTPSYDCRNYLLRVNSRSYLNDMTLLSLLESKSRSTCLYLSKTSSNDSSPKPSQPQVFNLCFASHSDDHLSMSQLSSRFLIAVSVANSAVDIVDRLPCCLRLGSKGLL